MSLDEMLHFVGEDQTEPEVVASIVGRVEVTMRRVTEFFIAIFATTSGTSGKTHFCAEELITMGTF